MKDPIDFHIRSLEQRLDNMAEENAALTEQNAKLEQWRREMILVWSPVIDHCQNSKYLKLGGSISTYALECIKESEIARVQMIEPITEKYIKSQSDNKRLRSALQKANQYAVAWQAKEIQPLLGENLDADIDYFYSLIHSDQPKS